MSSAGRLIASGDLTTINRALNFVICNSKLVTNLHMEKVATRGFFLYDRLWRFAPTDQTENRAWGKSECKPNNKLEDTTIPRYV